VFRFTIRDVLWLTALLALALGWWFDRDSVASQRDEALDDAMWLAQFSGPDGAGCGTAAGTVNAIREKYVTMRSVVGFPKPEPLTPDHQSRSKDNEP